MKDKRRRTLSPTRRRRQLMEEMMHDEIFDREYQAGRAALNDGFGRLIAAAGKSLQVLHAIQFDAPWKHSAPTNPGRSKAA